MGGWIRLHTTSDPQLMCCVKSFSYTIRLYVSANITGLHSSRAALTQCTSPSATALLEGVPFTAQNKTIYLRYQVVTSLLKHLNLKLDLVKFLSEVVSFRLRNRKLRGRFLPSQHPS
jgi:hypothetical protein